MANTVGMRATTVGASALLIGAALVAALTATISVQTHTMDGVPPILSIPFVREQPPTPPQPTHAVPPPQQNVEFTRTVFPTAQTLSPPASTDIPLDAGSGSGVGPVEITNPFWARRPTDLDRFYPTRAITRGVQGRAELDCLVSITGTLSCTVVSETPAGWGFGDAALRIAREYSMQPAMRNGTPVAGHYRMNVPFALR